jgi:glycosyltransferase involved in cell wall biosynthesis
VVVVDQSEDDDTRAVVDSWRDRIPVRRLTSDRGASRGLNVGIAALGDFDVLGIIGDDTSYAPETLSHAAAILAADTAIGVVSGRLLGAAGKPAQLTSFGDRRMVLNHQTVWTSAIEATCFYRAAFIRDVGDFDEELGVGAASPWQSGEGTDLLLRGLETGWKLVYDPRIVVYEDNPDDPDPGDRAYLMKARQRARGTGRVLRRHHGLVPQANAALRPLAAAVLSAACLRRVQASWYFQRFIGRLEGLTGHVLPLWEYGTGPRR